MRIGSLVHSIINAVLQENAEHLASLYIVCLSIAFCACHISYVQCLHLINSIAIHKFLILNGKLFYSEFSLIQTDPACMSNSIMFFLSLGIYNSRLDVIEFLCCSFLSLTVDNFS